MNEQQMLCKLLSGIFRKEITEKDLTEEIVSQAVEAVTQMRVENKQLQNLSVGVIFAMLEAIEKKDNYTCRHSDRVADICLKLGKKLGKNTSEQKALYYAALLHDVGKIGIPDDVIHKTSRLSNEEFETIKGHPVIGSEILNMITEIPEIDVGAKYHHERFDGRGYPEGLVGENIPEIARIVAVADCFDAMTSQRTYNNPMDLRQAREQFVLGSGTQFDPVCAQKMIEIIDEALAEGCTRGEEI